MSNNEYEILYGQDSEFKPQDFRSVSKAVSHELSVKENNDKIAKKFYDAKEAAELDQAIKDDMTKRIIESDVNLDEKVTLDVTKTLSNAQQGIDEWAFINASEFADRYEQQMSAANYGGFVMTNLMRDTSARFGGSSDFGRMFASLDPYGYQSMRDAAQAHGIVGSGGGLAIDEFAFGSPVQELAARTFNSLSNFFFPDREATTSHKMSDIDEDQFMYHSDVAGTPLYRMVNERDPNWTPKKKEMIMFAMFGDPNSVAPDAAKDLSLQMLNMIGVTPNDVERSNSYGHLMTIINTKRVAFEAAEYASGASSWELFGAFATNMGKTIVSDSEMIAELAVTGGLAAPLKVGTAMTKVGHGVLMHGVKARRAANIAGITARTKGTTEVVTGTNALAHWSARATGRTLMAAGQSLEKTASLATAFNPFTIGERIIAPAIRDVRMLRQASKATKESVKEVRKLKDAVDKTVGGATGVVLRNALFNSGGGVGVRGGLMAAMLDGGVQNYLAYAYTRDEEAAMAKAVYGDLADYSGIQYAFTRGTGPMDFMNSGLGSIALGFTFGAALGTFTRVLGASAFDPEGKMTGATSREAAMLTRNPLKLVSIMAKEQVRRVKASSAALRDQASSFAASVADGGVNAAVIASTHIAGSLAKAGSLTFSAQQKLDAIMVSAMLGGVNVQRLARKAATATGLDMAKLKKMIKDEMRTGSARARRRALRRNGGPSLAIRMAAMAFNTKRVDVAVREGIDGDGSHRMMLDELIEETEPGQLRDGLVEFRENLDIFTEDVLDVIKDRLGKFGRWNELDQETKQRLLDDVARATETRPVTVKEMDDAVARVESGAVEKRIEAREKRARERYEKKRQAAAKKAKATEKAGKDRTSSSIDPDEATLDAMSLADLRLLAKKRGLKSKARSTKDLRARLKEELGLGEQKQLSFEEEYVPQAPDEARVEEAVEAVFRDNVQESRLADTTNGQDIAAMVESQAAPVRGSIEANLDDAFVRHLVERATNAEDVDARNPENLVPEWDLKALIARAKPRADAIRALLGENPDAEAKAELEGKKGSEIKQMIFDEFGLDVINAKDTGADLKDRGFDAASLGELYLDLKMLKKINTLKKKQRAKLKKDPILEVALGEPLAQQRLARQLVTNLRALASDPTLVDSNGRVLVADMINAMPPGFEGLLHTVFRRAEMRGGDNTYFDISVARMEAERRLAMADSNFRKEFLRVHEENKAKLTPTEREIVDGVREFDNAAAQTGEFLQARANAQRGAVARSGRYERLRGDRTDKEYLLEQEQEVVRGIIDGWSAIHDGPAKDNLARRLGVEDMAGRAELFAPDPTKRKGQSDEDYLAKIERLQKDRAVFADRLKKGASKLVGEPIGDFESLMNGVDDAQLGYHVGRAFTEAISGNVPQNSTRAMSVGSQEVNRVQGGFLGRMRNEQFIKLYQQHTKERLMDHVFNMGEPVNASAVRQLSADQIEEVLQDLEALAEAAKSGKLTPEMEARLNRVGYDAADRVRIIPTQTIKNLNKKIQGVRKFIDDQMAFVLETPPGVINMLHDEASVNATGFDQSIILGNLPGKKTGSKDVSADSGMSSGVVMPGSWKDIWNLRNEAIFGTTAGFSKAASAMGLKNVAEAIEADGTDLGFIKMLRDLESVDNAEDASAQAVTMAVAIARDMGEGAENQRQFQAALKEVRKLMNAAGADSLMSAAAEVEAKMARFLDDPSNIDRYSEIGLEFIRSDAAGPAWKALLDEYVETDGEVSSFKQGTNKVVSAALRDFFKPPVMTIVYGAGIPAFRRNAQEKLEAIASQLPADKQAAFRENIPEMLNSWMSQLEGDDNIIRRTLNLQPAQELVETVRKRNLVELDPDSPMFEVPVGDGSTKPITMNLIASGRWLTGSPAMRAHVHRHLVSLSDQYFGINSPELGLWLVKLAAGQNARRTKRAIARMQKNVDAARTEDGSLDLDRLNEIYNPINTYMSSIDSANRLGYIPKKSVVEKQLEMLGIDKRQLDPMFYRSLEHQLALYQNTGPAAGRKFGFFDGPKIVRNQNPETTVGEYLHIKDDQQVGQVFLSDSVRDAEAAGVGADAEQFEQAIKSAIVKQLLIDVGSVYLPKGFRNPSMDEFVGDSQITGNSAKTRREMMEKNEEDYARLRARPVEDLTEEERLTLATLEGLRQTVYGVDPETGRAKTASGSSLIASKIRAQHLMDVGTDRDVPSDLGVPAMQVLAHKINDREMRGIADGNVTEEAIASNVVAFKPDEAIAPSPLHPAFIDNARSQPKPHRTEATDEQIADEMGRRTEESIEAEKRIEEAVASERETTVNAVRLERVAKRIEQETRAERARIMRRYKSEEQRQLRLEAMQTRMRIRLENAVRDTTGVPLNPDDAVKRNAFKIRKDKLKFERGGNETPMEALQRMVAQNDLTELAGLMLGPVQRLGVDLRRRGQTDNILPFSAARSPMTVFALDWYLMGGTSRDYAAMTVARMYMAFKAANPDSPNAASIQAFMKGVNQAGFRKSLEDFIKNDYNGLQTKADMERWFLDGEEAKGFLDDTYLADDAKIIDFGEEMDAEFGVEMPPLPRRLSMNTEEKITFIGIRDYLLNDPARLEYIRNATGLKELTADEIAIAFTKSDEQLLAAAAEDDPSAAIIPRHKEDDKGPYVDPFEVDRINSRELTDENVRPDSMPVFSYDQILHLINMPANRNLVANLVLHQMLGVDIDLNARLDAKVKDTVDPYATGAKAHGFMSNPTTKDEADALIVESVEAPMAEYGRLAWRSLSQESRTAIRDLEYGAGDEIIGAVVMMRNAGLLDEQGVPTEAGLKFLSNAGLSNDVDVIPDIAAAVKHTEAKAEAARAEVDLDSQVRNNLEEVMDEEGRMIYEETGEASPFRDDADDTPAPQKPKPGSKTPEEVEGTEIDVATTEGRTKAGDQLLEFLRGRAVLHSQNAANAFESFTGRNGDGGTMSDAEAATLLEMAYLDNDLGMALFSGTKMDFRQGGPLSTQLLEKSRSTVIRGLNRVNSKMKEGKVDGALYLFLHELVERLDLLHLSTVRDPGGTSRGQTGLNSSKVAQHFITNFGSPEARLKFVKVLKELGLFDDDMKRFVKDVEDYFNRDPRFFPKDGAVSKDFYGARKAVSEDAKPATPGEDQNPNFALMTEGYTQALTLTLFNNTIRRNLPQEAGIAAMLKAKLMDIISVVRHVGVDGDIKSGTKLNKLGMSMFEDGSYAKQLMGQLESLAAKAMDYEPEAYLGTSKPGTAHLEVRYMGGAPSARSIKDIEADIANLERTLEGTSNRYHRQALVIEIDKLREELGLAAVDPAALAADRAALLAKAKGSEDDRGLVNPARIPEAERGAVVNAKVDGFLDTIEAERSGGIGRQFNFFAGFLVAGKGVYAPNNAKHRYVRAIGQLMNPEMINGKVNGHTWIPDQMAMSYLGADLSKAIHNLEFFRKRVKKLKGQELEEFTRKMDLALRTRDDLERGRMFRELGLSEKEVARVEDFYQHMFHPDSGFIDRLARNLVETGVITPQQHAKFRDTPGLPMQFVRTQELNGAELQRTIRGALRDVGVRHLKEQSRNGIIEVDILDAQGIFMQRTTNEFVMQNNYNDLSPSLRTFYEDLADQMEANGIEVAGPPHMRAYRASEFLKDQMRTRSEDRLGFAEPFTNSKELFRPYNQYLQAASEGVSARDSAVKSYDPITGERVDKSRAQLINEQSRTQDKFTAEDGLDLMAGREFTDLKTGGKLGESRLVGNRANLINNEQIAPYLDLDTQNQLNSLIGSNAIMAMGTSIQQRAIGVRGGSTVMIIDNLKARLEGNDPSAWPRNDDGSEMTFAEREQMLEELLELKNQLRSGYNMKPEGLDEDGPRARALRALSRIGVSMVSAGNFALSAIVEVLAGLPRTLGKVMHGDLKAIGDYFAMVSPAARRKIMESVDGFELAKMHLGIHTRFGDMGYDDIMSLTRTDDGSTGIFTLDNLERISRKASGFAMTGFSTITEYSRAVSAAQAIRKAKRMANSPKGGFAALGRELAALSDDADAKAIRGAARKVGIDGQMAVHLSQAGMADPKLLEAMDSLIRDPKYFSDKGLNLEELYRTGEYTQYEIAAVKTILQFENNRINLDPRMGNKQIPRSVFQQMMGVLGQFPILFYSRMRQSKYQGGGMAVAGFLGLMLLGEMYYTNLALLARGEDPERLLERMRSADPSWILNTVENMNVMGGASPVLSGIMGLAVDSLREMTGNPELLANYQKSIVRSPVGFAGLEMLKTGVGNNLQAMSSFYAGDYARGAHKLVGGTPVPVQQLPKFLIHQFLDQTPEGRMISTPSRSTGPSLAVRAAQARRRAILAQDSDAPAQRALTSQAAPTGVSEETAPAGPTGAATDPPSSPPAQGDGGSSANDGGEQLMDIVTEE